MKEAYDFLRKCGTFFIATEENGQPHVRPFGALSDYEGKLYIETNNQKKVYQQLSKNGKVEICGMFEGKWIRIEGVMKDQKTIRSRRKRRKRNAEN